MIDLSERVKAAREALGYKKYVLRPNTTNMKDVTGQKCGTLIILEPTGEREGSQIKWSCFCSNCGKFLLVPITRLLGDSRQKSCGCLTSQILSKSLSRHGMTDTPTWKSWKSMLDRCYLKKHKSYGDYGGRGVVVCDRWMEFESFYEDMGVRPIKTTLGRINNSSGYSPENCRWETPKEQCRNRRSSRFITMFGDTKTLAEWCEIFGIEPATVQSRLRHNWDIEKALSAGKKKQKNSVTPISPKHEYFENLRRVGVYHLAGVTA